MKNYFIFFVFFIFIFSCSSEKKETVDANSLIKPKFQFNDYLFECNIKENSNLINLEAFLSNFVKGPLTKDDIDTFKVYVPKSNSFQTFIFHLQTSIDKDIYIDFIETLSQKGFDKIAVCEFNSNKLTSFNELSIDLNLSDIEFSEILRCEYNTDYNYGNFRISINKFLDQMRSLKIPYELNYIQEDSSSREFTWINNFYTKDFSSQISTKWINSYEANQIKNEFLSNAQCLDSNIYQTFKII